MIFKVKKSLLLSASVTAVQAGAVVLVVTLPVGVGWKVLLVALVMASFVGRPWRAPVLTIELDDQGRLRFAPDGEPYRVTGAARDPFALRFTLETGDGRHRTLLLMRDALDSTTYHALSGRIAQRLLPPAENAGQ